MPDEEFQNENEEARQADDAAASYEAQMSDEQSAFEHDYDETMKMLSGGNYD